ncbi:MAG TPA: glucan biosynthesis protein D [Polyangiaceae bacterium]|jgi:glucans biosynthesis protein|nr:glucan biosynthesis protein D [Polyangiaceae bacterium]
MQRRHFLKSAGALAAFGVTQGNAWMRDAEAAPRAANQGRPFDYAALKGQARALAGAAYRPAPSRVPDAVKALDWRQYQSIRYRKERALWAADHRNFVVNFFHPGLSYTAPVAMFELVDGRAREIPFDPSLFDYSGSGLDPAMAKDLGFAGFRLFRSRDLTRDVVAFLGASYFRAVGSEMQFGISARGLAVDSGMPKPEEFPVFTSFWFERPAPGADSVVVYALLDSPSVAGAYRFEVHAGAVLVMDVDAALYPRKPIERLGVAPLTSMFQYGENDHRIVNDWRPEVHDSDGLSLWTGANEWIWRPLVNPQTLRFNAFQDDNPRGFGLLQRDRSFDHYQDDAFFYERRPNLWVEPKSGWGKGSVDLVELPTMDETSDNIVAFWNPEKKPSPGEELLFAYRLHWGAKMPAASPLATVVATRSGPGGNVGEKRRYFSWRFVVDFAGKSLSELGPGAQVVPVATPSRGKVELVSAHPIAELKGYRVEFDLVPDDMKPDPIDVRLVLRKDGRTLTETWLYQWSPPERRPL